MQKISGGWGACPRGHALCASGPPPFLFSWICPCSTAVSSKNSTKATLGSGYKSLSNHLNQFKDLGHMPVDVKRLDEGDGIEATLMRHQAGWHKTCYLKYNQTKLKRLHKRSVAVKEKTDIRGVYTRLSQGGIDLTESKCFLCEEPAGSAGLHNVSTYDTDAKVWRCATVLEDTALLAKLAPGDMIALEAKYHLKCLSTLYNRARATDGTSSDSDNCFLVISTNK